MSPRRKGPIRHPVKSHIRSGVRVSKHEKGFGKLAKKAKKRLADQKVRLSKQRVARVSGFNVSLFFSDKPRETVNVGGNTYTAGTKNGLSSMKTPAVPVRMQIRRRNR